MYKSIRISKINIGKEDDNTVVYRILNLLYLNAKEVRFSGYFKSNKGSTKLFIQPLFSSGNGKKHEVLIESPDWKRYELALAIPQEALDEKEKMISGSPQLRRHRALNILTSKLNPDEVMNKYMSPFADINPGNKSESNGTRLVIERDGKGQNVTIASSGRRDMFFNPVDERKYLSETIVEIEPGIFYINMAKCMENEIEQKIDVLANAKAVIYDQRGGGRLSFFTLYPIWLKRR